MQAQRISAWLGIALSLIGGPLKIVRIMRQSEALPWQLYDFIALGILLVGAVMVLREKSGRVLSAGWGFGVAMFYGSFFGHLESWMTGTGDHAFEHSMVVIGGSFFALNIIGLVLSLMKPSNVLA